MVTSKRRIAGIVLLVLALLICAFSITACVCSTKTVAYAETAEVAETDETPEEKLPETFGSRVGQWFENNLLKFLTGANFAGIVACVGTIIGELRSNKKHKEAVKKILDTNTDSNADVVTTVNTLIEAHNSLLLQVEELDAKTVKTDGSIAQLQGVVLQVQVLSKAVLDILATVYANNKNLPQGVKDLVSLKYVGALKAENADVSATDLLVTGTTEGE